MSCLLTLFNAKHCVVNTLLDFKHFPVDFISQTLYIDLSCWKARLNKLVTTEGVGSSGKQAPNPVFYKGDNFGPRQKKPN